MRSGISCFNGTLYRKTMTRFWPIWALYGLFWMFAIPLNLMTHYFDFLRWNSDPQEGMLDLAQSIPEYLSPGTWLAALMGLLCAMACFGYLYNNRSACMMHALPMRRETLFFTQYLAGLSFLLLPVAAVALCGLLVELALLPSNMWADALPCLAGWFLAHSGACLFFFSFAAFCAMFTGHILALPVFYAVLNGLAMAIYVLIEALLAQFYYGFYMQMPDHDLVYYLTPLYALTEAAQRNYNSSRIFFIEDPLLVAIYAGVGVVLAVLALMIYRSRQVESAGDVVSIPLVRPLFQIGVAFCAGLSLGVFTAIFFSCYDQPLALTLCILVWTAAGFFVAEMLLKKSFRVLGAWKRCIAMAAAMAVLCLVSFLDPFGIEGHTPQAGEVASVRLSLDACYPYDSGQFVGLDLTDPQHVQQVIDLHKAILRDKDRTDFPDDSAFINLDYTLTDGTHMTRRYDQVGLFKDDADTEGTLTWQVNQLISDRGLIAQAYGFDQVDEGTLMDAFLSDVYNAQEQSYDNLSLTDYRQQLWQAVKADFQAGNIGKRYLFDDEDRNQNTYITDLCFPWAMLDKNGRQTNSSGNLTITLTPQAANTLAVLESTGLLGDNYQLRAHSWDNDNDSYDYYDAVGGWDTSGSETVSEPAATENLGPNYGIIGGADGPTVIVSGTAITG